jgi:hypothetical protein
MSLRPLGLPVLAILLLALPLVGDSTAQPAANATGGGVVITSVPSGAVVELLGDHALRGVTPWRLERGLSGTYEIRARMTGYEEWTGVTVLSATTVEEIEIRLTRKTASGAGFRSVIIPGWGQVYADQAAKGAFFFIAEAVALGGLVWTQSNYVDAKDTYEEAYDDYLDATQIEEIELAWEEVESTYSDAEDWQQKRDVWMYAAIGIWAINVVDAFMISPPTSEAPTVSQLGAEPSGFYAALTPDGSTVGFAIKF